MKVVIACTLAALIVFAFLAFSGEDKAKVPSADSQAEAENTVKLIDGNRVMLGEEVNNETETFNDLLVQLKEQGDQLESVNKVLANLQNNPPVSQPIPQLNVNQNYVDQVTKTQQAFVEKLANMEDEIATLTKPHPKPSIPKDSDTDIVDHADLPIGVQKNAKLAYNQSPRLVDPDSVNPQLEAREVKSTVSSQNSQWIYPLNTSFSTDSNGKKIAITPTTKQRPTLAENSSGKQEGLGNKNANKKPKVIPIATIPDGATLLDTRTLTALIGRVPVGQQVIDPYPFKLKVGKKNLASNYKNIPMLDGVIVQGITRGNRTLQCVFANVTKLTFTFTDGRIVTMPTQKGATNGSSRSSLPHIGYLSDNQGVPCITGININNRKEYISQKVGLDAFQAAARALADNERTRITGSDSVTETVTGNAGKVILGESIAAGAESGASIASDFMSEAFEGIYVPNNRLVTLHIESELAIDYDPQGRKIFYDNAIPSSDKSYNSGRL